MTDTTTEAVTATTVDILGGVFVVTGDGIRVERDGIVEHFDATDTLNLLTALRHHELALRNTSTVQQRIIAWENTAETVALLAQRDVFPRHVAESPFGGVDVDLGDQVDALTRIAAAEQVEVDIIERPGYIDHTATIRPGVHLIAYEVKP